MKGSLIYTLLAAAVLFLVVVPLGTSVFLFGFIHGDSPCILCWAQRLGMALVALIGLFILRYGPRPRYVGLGVLVSSYGVFMAIRHSSLHLARDVGQGFAIEMFGAHTYTGRSRCSGSASWSWRSCCWRRRPKTCSRSRPARCAGWAGSPWSVS
jgi:disulfide bond formation protein DsbB